MFWWKSFEASRLQVEGSEGSDIADLQRILNRRAGWYGIEIEVTGVYDQQTRDGVSAFQFAALHIPNADGFIGPLTANRLRIRLTEEES